MRNHCSFQFIASVGVCLGAGALLSCADAAGMAVAHKPFALENGTQISLAQLERGREKYTLYCRACHGEKGDGRGPAGIGLRPPPRDFTEPVFKFGGVEAGELPPDSELKRIIRGGLQGTAMLPWEIPDQELDDIVQYIKGFSEVWTEDEIAEPTEIPDDPWAGKEAQGIARGKVVYHGMAQCQKCHAAYATRQEIWDAVKETTGQGSINAFRKNMYFPEAKYSRAFKHKLLPPDFTRHEVRAGTTPKDIFRTIASGISGTAMPTWKGSLPDPDIWAISHYVSSLVALKGKPEAVKLRQAMLNQPAFVPPTPPEETPEAEEEPQEGKEP